jgi:uncharacterized cysteine cluster protein YcgN (CxxCxxCC family)
MSERAADTATEPPFWETKPLSAMSRVEWESLCDGCGQCCLVKVEDEETSRVFLTRLACRLLDVGSCRCTDYANRHFLMPDCLRLSPANLERIFWLPESCAYRRVNEGRGLEWWHPLISGRPETVHEAGISVSGWALSETAGHPDTMQRYIIEEIDAPAADAADAPQAATPPRA